MTELEFEDLSISLARHLVEHPNDPIDVVVNGEYDPSFMFTQEGKLVLLLIPFA